MTTAVTTAGDNLLGGMQVPAFLKQDVEQSTLFQQSTGSSVDRITQVDGAIVMEVAGVKSQPMLSIDVVILDAQPAGRDTYRAYYEGVYREGESLAPTCYSSDGKVPSPHAEKPQCSNCAQCPMNVSGSGINGEGRACGYFKHVAVAKYPELDNIYRIKVSSRSLFSKDKNGVPSPLGGVAFGFTNYAGVLQRAKAPWEGVVTRVSLPKGQTHGFFFNAVGWVQSEDEYARIKELQKAPNLIEVLAVEVGGNVGVTATAGLPSPPAYMALPPAYMALPPAQPKLVGRDKWLASDIVPQPVKDWIVQVDDNTAQQYLQQYYPQAL